LLDEDQTPVRRRRYDAHDTRAADPLRKRPSTAIYEPEVLCFRDDRVCIRLVDIHDRTLISR
jgi:hypothetical protein